MDRKCKNCFLPLGATQTECSNCGAHNPLEQKSSLYSGSVTTAVAPSPQDYGMMWFKFLIYFQLFAAALLNVINALSVLKGTHLQGFAEEFYAQSYALKMADNFYGICLIVLAVLCIVVRFRLAGFYSNGPGLYIMLLVANILVPLVYGFLLTNAGSISIEVYTGWYRDTVTYQFDGWASLFGSAIGSGVLLICNGIYFNKRKELFRF